MNEKPNRPLIPNTIRLVLALGLLCFLTGCGTIHNSLYPIPPQPSYAAAHPGLISLKTSDGVRLAARHLQAPGNETTIIFSHGNGEDLGHSLDFQDGLHAMGVDVLAYDYRGYGQSGGRPSEAGLYRDIEAAYRHAKASGAKRIVLFGGSLGGGPSVELASRTKVDGLVLRSTFSSVHAVARLGWLPGSPYNNLAKIGQVDCPVLIIHGERDAFIPVRHSEKLYARATRPKRLVRIPGKGHNDIWLDAYREELRSFIKQIRAGT